MWRRASAEKFPGKGGKERPNPRNSITKPPSIISVMGYGAHWACTQGLPKGNAAQSAACKK